MRNTPQTTQNLIIPQKGNDETNQALLDDLMSVSDEEIREEIDKMNAFKSEETQSFAGEITQDDVIKMMQEANKNNAVGNAYRKLLRENFQVIGRIGGMDVEFDESRRIVKFGGETFDLNPTEGKMDFMSKVMKYDDLFSDSVRKVMLKINM